MYVLYDVTLALGALLRDALLKVSVAAGHNFHDAGLSSSCTVVEMFG